MWRFLKKLKIELSYNPAIPSWVFIHTHTHTHTHTHNKILAIKKNEIL